MAATARLDGTPMGRQAGLHEDLRREEEVKGSSERGFGLVFAAFFCIVGAVKAWNGSPWSLAWFGAAVAVALAAFLVPRTLAPANRLWMKFGLLLFRIVNPVVMLLVYLICIVPIGVGMRLFGRDPMRRRFEPGSASYWIRRDPPGPLESMKNQF